ncbi:hypothetical protein HH212_17720 [Massilia forsythiae]|uniref:Uncharacterized protein n=1 Tax=Massilia forsythiae TaxID=2728020 RepID=A0A7Z2VYN1_9BURK|nr:hypothetical protein [Massilia forsythiae]QJE01639.1 hypothetical protein HH212_17720 [Massilia forsythiae]
MKFTKTARATAASAGARLDHRREAQEAGVVGHVVVDTLQEDEERPS